MSEVQVDSPSLANNNSNNNAIPLRDLYPGKRQRLSLKTWKCRPMQNKQPCEPSAPAIDKETVKGKESEVKTATILPNCSTDIVSQTEHLNSNLSVTCTLINIGNTCYLNSIIYALRYMKEFRKSLHDLCCRIQALVSSTVCDFQVNSYHTVILQLHELFRSMHDMEAAGQQTQNSNKTDNQKHIRNLPCLSLIPKKLMESFREVNATFEGDQQHDAHEFLGFLLSCLEKTFQNYEQWLRELQSRKSTRRNKKAQTITEKQISCPVATFEGKSLLKTLCLECEHLSEMEDSFRDVAIAFLPDLELSFDDNNVGYFTRALHATETLRDEEKFWCNFCYHHNEALRSGQFVQLPPVLIIQLKPTVLSTTILDGLHKSSSHPLALPEVLPCLLESCEKPCLDQAHCFHLSAIVCHTGPSLSSGHYTTYLKGNQFSANAELPLLGSNQPLPQPKDEDMSKRYNTRKKIMENHQSSLSKECCNPVVLPRTGNLWLYFDDERVTTADVLPQFNSKNSTETPYLLFYQKVTEIENS